LNGEADQRSNRDLTECEEVVRLSDRPRPSAASSVGDRMKLHRRHARAGGRDYTVISPRPGLDVRFSTNFFHGTWHVLSDYRGARFIGRLLWGLSFARVPGIVVVIDRPFLDPNPFDGAPADPILFAPAQLTPLSDRSAADLRRALPRAEHTGTVRWRTGGLDAAVETRRRAWWTPGEYRKPYMPPRGPERMARLGGFVSLCASPQWLREYAPYLYGLGEHTYRGSASAEIDWPNGELQIFRDYRRRVSAAQVARREILATVPVADNPEELIWKRGAEVRHRGRFRPFPSAPPEPEPAAVRATWPGPTPYGPVAVP
jgi:hypothetical protein